MSDDDAVAFGGIGAVAVGAAALAAIARMQMNGASCARSDFDIKPPFMNFSHSLSLALEPQVESNDGRAQIRIVSLHDH
jgi:hypothetical protein